MQHVNLNTNLNFKVLRLLKSKAVIFSGVVDIFIAVNAKWKQKGPLKKYKNGFYHNYFHLKITLINMICLTILAHLYGI